MCIVKYIVIGGASCPVIAGLNVYITGILKSIDVRVALRLDNGRVKHFFKCIVEYIAIVEASCPGIG
jgi:hypothetical protein